MNKKLLLLALLLCLAGGAFASTLIQGNWRWRNDNGDENTATFKAAQNTPITIADYSALRLRIRVENESTSASQTHSVGGLKYSTAVDGPFVDVKSDPTTEPFVYAQSSVAPDSKAPTANSTFLTTINAAGISPFTYAAGQYFDGDRDLTDNSDKSPIVPGNYSDLEFVIKPTPNALPNTTYYFIIENAKEEASHNIASLTTASVLPVNFLSFDAKAVNNRVQLKWSTASEKNNERFEIRKSRDLINWQLLGSKPGQGNTDAVTNYSLTDQQPFNGTTYYELAQFDFDGTKSVLARKPVSITLSPSVDVQVFPNPTVKEINLELVNYHGKDFEASLFSSEGKLVYKETFNASAVDKKLNMSAKPSAGIYILKIKGQGLALNKKVVIL